MAKPASTRGRLLLPLPLCSLEVGGLARREVQLDVGGDGTPATGHAHIGAAEQRLMLFAALDGGQRYRADVRVLAADGGDARFACGA